ncbi:MAG TPA: hypothetical protein ENN32_04430, partial [Chloroflexi bacterium]|nr:hypothetical protein [Chloroflexota bacterium]
MYFGVLPLALAVGVTFVPTRKPSRSIILILAVLAVLTLCIALRLPGFEALNYLPILNKVNNTRFKWYFAFLGAILAAFGLDALDHYLNSGDRRHKNILYGGAGVLGLAWLILVLVGIGKFLIAPFLEITPDTFYAHLLFSVFSVTQLRMVISIFVVVAAPLLYVMLRHKFQQYPVFIWVLISLTFLELIVQAHDYNTTVSRDMLFPEPPLIQQLEQDQDIFRIMGSPPVLWPNYGAVYGLFHIGGYDLPVFKLAADVYQAQGGQGYRQIWQPEWPLVDWMNVKYIFSNHALSLEKLELVADGGAYKLYRNTAVLPRAYMVYEVNVISDAFLQLQTLTSGFFDFQYTALLAENLPAMQSGY